MLGKSYIKAWNVVNSLAFRFINKYITMRDYRLRGFEDKYDLALKSSFMYDGFRDDFINTQIGNEDTLSSSQVNYILTQEGLNTVYPVSKLQRIDYETWKESEELCIYYEKWEELAYIVCSKFDVEISAMPIMCELVEEIVVSDLDCYLEENIEVNPVKCELTENLEVEEINCTLETDIETKAVECLLQSDIQIEPQNCESKINVRAYAAYLQEKYKVNEDLAICIIGDLMPEAIRLNNYCGFDVDPENNES